MQKSSWNIFKTFFKIGTLLIGGGYVILPLLKSEIADKRAWADFDEICDYYALSQSLPGLVAANVSIFTGCKLNGQKGALAALAGITAPSFLAILLIASILEELIRNNIVQYIFAGVGVGVVVLLILAVKEMWTRSIVDKFTLVVFLTAFLLAVFKISPVIIILGSIFAGYVYGIKNSVKMEDK